MTGAHPQREKTRLLRRATTIREQNSRLRNYLAINRNVRALYGRRRLKTRFASSIEVHSLLRTRLRLVKG